MNTIRRTPTIKHQADFNLELIVLRLDYVILCYVDDVQGY